MHAIADFDRARKRVELDAPEIIVHLFGFDNIPAGMRDCVGRTPMGVSRLLMIPVSNPASR